MILIGSRALKIHCNFKRNPADFDFITTEKEFGPWMDKNKEYLSPSKVYSLPEFNKIIVESHSPGGNCEFEFVQKDSSNELLLDLTENDPTLVRHEMFGTIPNIDTLFTIKASHRYKSVKPDFFWKTVYDYQLLKKMGAKITDELKPFYDLREKETYGNIQFPKLNVDKKEFFVNQNQLTYVYNHDDIHQAVAIGDKPAYLSYNKEGSEVLSSKKKFFEVSERVRINGCIEEACVLAIERSLVPHPGAKTPNQAWHYALMKMCYGIVSGFFRDYLYENLYTIRDQYPKNYFDRFNQALADGKIAPFSS